MADVQNIITLGIGSAPGDIRYFVLMGLDVSPSTAEPITLTLNARSAALTLETRSLGLTLDTRSAALTLETR